MITRIAQNSQSALTLTLYAGGVATDAAGTVTLKVTREDGTVLVAAGTSAVKPPSTTGIYTFTLTPAHTAELDLLTVVWTADLQGAVQLFEERVEVVGDYVFSIAEARRMAPLGDTATYPPDRIAEERTRAEEAFEDACGQAFVPRYAREVLNGKYCTELRLRRTPSRLLAVSVDGVVLDAPALAALKILPSGDLYREAGWTIGVQNTVVKYVHGFATPPARESRACLLLARHYLVGSPFDERTTRVTLDGASADLATAEGGKFGLPEVDAIVEAYRARRPLRLT